MLIPQELQLSRSTAQFENLGELGLSRFLVGIRI